MSSPGVNVLVVDDDIAVCRILHRMLSDEQYNVQTSQSVGDALAAIEQKPFDAYVMDYKLPDGTGLDVAEQIRTKGSEAPIILISGYDPSAVALRAEKLRISNIIEKPFSRATICDAVKKGLGISLNGNEAALGSASLGGAAPARAGMAQSAATRMRLPKAAIITGILLLLILVCLAFYLFPHGL
jgi:two-component system, LuxR family, response regulator FixJ